jgi:hypothetical protein
MFPSFPRYKEGTGRRGQIEPGPPVVKSSGVRQTLVFPVPFQFKSLTARILFVLSNIHARSQQPGKPAYPYKHTIIFTIKITQRGVHINKPLEFTGSCLGRPVLHVMLSASVFIIVPSSLKNQFYFGQLYF